MGGRCGFVDIEENEDASSEDAVDMAEGSESDQEDLEFDRLTLDELKEYLSQH